MNDTHALVHAKVLTIVRRRAPKVAEVHDSQELRKDLGLDSLDLAELASMLESALDAPVFDDAPVGSIVTIGELCEICETLGAAK